MKIKLSLLDDDNKEIDYIEREYPIINYNYNLPIGMVIDLNLLVWRNDLANDKIIEQLRTLLSL